MTAYEVILERRVAELECKYTALAAKVTEYLSELEKLLSTGTFTLGARQ